MIEQSLKYITKKVQAGNLQVIYNLIFSNALYSLECYKDGCSLQDPNNYYFVEDITEDEGEADDFLDLLVKGKVAPVHINDIVEDYFQD